MASPVSAALALLPEHRIHNPAPSPQPADRGGGLGVGGGGGEDGEGIMSWSAF